LFCKIRVLVNEHLNSTYMAWSNCCSGWNRCWNKNLFYECFNDSKHHGI